MFYDRNNVPSMSMFYPDREDSMIFPVCKKLGANVSGHSEGKDLSHVEKKFRDLKESIRIF